MSGLDVGLAKVIALKEEWLAKGFGEGVGKTVAEIEAGGMAAFAVVGISLASEKCLVFGDRLDRNS